MILLDSCAVLDILFGEVDAEPLSIFLDAEQSNGTEVVFLPLTLLESSSVVAIRFKEKNVKNLDLDYYLEQLIGFSTHGINDDLTTEIIAEAARIKAVHAASMVDCYLIANSLRRGAEIVTADAEILKYQPKRARIRKLTKKYSTIKWRR